MAMYSAFFDEAGSPSDPQHLILAGCIADVRQWVHFEREWKRELSPWGTELLHTTYFQQREPPFHNLTDTEADALLGRLVGIVLRRVELPIVCYMPLDRHRATNKQYLLSETYGYPWPAAARSCMHEVMAWARRHDVAEDTVEHLFEDGANQKGQLLWIAECDRIRTPVFKKKHEAIPLQAGDLIGWLGLRALNRGKLSDKLQRVLEKLAERTKSVHINVEEIPKLFSIAARDPDYYYKVQIIKKDGKRIALTHYWPKATSRCMDDTSASITLLGHEP